MGTQDESGVLLSDVGSGGGEPAFPANRLEEAAAAGQVQVISVAEGELRFRDAECVGEFLSAQRGFARQALGSDVALVGAEVILGQGRAGAGQQTIRFALNRIIGAHVGVTSSGTLFLSFAVHHSAAAHHHHHACISFHVVFRTSSASGSGSGSGGGGEGGASKDDAEADSTLPLQTSRKTWEAWVANLQVRAELRDVEHCLCLRFFCQRNCAGAHLLLSLWFAH